MFSRVFSPKLLFSEIPFSEALLHGKEKVSERLNDIASYHLIEHSVEHIIQTVLNRYLPFAPKILKKDAAIERIRPARDCVWPDGMNPPLPGRVATYVIPFDGPTGFLKLRPDFPIPKIYAEWDDAYLTLLINADDGRNDSLFNDALTSIQMTLDRYDDVLKDERTKLAESFRPTLSAMRQELVDLDERTNQSEYSKPPAIEAPPLYEYPLTTVKIDIPVTSEMPGGDPHPVLHELHYNQILTSISSATSAIIRMPKAFARMGEEELRSVLLVALNMHYRGQALGEVFSSEGKTDILIVADDHVIFIAECKIWQGKAKYLEALAQLFGYITWRDTKAAIIIFNRNKNTTQVLNTIEEATKLSNNYLSHDGRDGATLRFTMSHTSDTARELTLTALVIDVPRHVPKTGNKSTTNSNITQ